MEFTKKEKEEALLFIENEIVLANKFIERKKTEKYINEQELEKMIKRTEKRIDAYKQISKAISI